MPVRNDFSPGEFCWIDLMAHDLEAAAAWYGELFGWSHAMAETHGGGPPYAFFMHGANGVGGVGQMQDEMKAQGVPPMWNAYVCTDDCAATEARARELGATVTVPTSEIPGNGKLAYFMDPEGGSIAVWQSTNPDGPGTLVGEHGSLSWTELMCRDIEQAQKFYGELFGWTYQPMPMGDVDYQMIKSGDRDVGGMMPMNGPQFEGIPPHWMVYFEVDDCDAITAKAQATGGAIRVPPTDIPVGKFSVLADPQGGGFSLVQSNRGDC